MKFTLAIEAKNEHNAVDLLRLLEETFEDDYASYGEGIETLKLMNGAKKALGEWERPSTDFVVSASFIVNAKDEDEAQKIFFEAIKSTALNVDIVEVEHY